jgi:D-alanine transaminase
VVTRTAKSGILAGITRAVLIDVLASMQLTLEERNFTPQEACEAAEAFVSSASQIVMPVISIDGKTIGDGKPGGIAKRLRDQFHHFAAIS